MKKSTLEHGMVEQSIPMIDLSIQFFSGRSSITNTNQTADSFPNKSFRLNSAPKARIINATETTIITIIICVYII